MKKILYLVICLPILALSSCLKTSQGSTTCSYDECGLVVDTSELAMVQDYLNTHNIYYASKHCSGMYYKIVTQGTGISPVACSLISVTYKGYFTDGTVFDQSTSPVTFQLSNLIRGWINGIPHLNVGGKIIMYIPPSLGYGKADYGQPGTNNFIPGNSMLIFEVDLLAAQ